VTAPALAQEQPDGSRKYVHPITDEKVPSVTTILREAIAKPRLMGWATGVAARYSVETWDWLGQQPPSERIEMIRYAHDRERQKASDLGTEVHSVIDDWCAGRPHENTKATAPYLNNFISFMFAKKPHFIENEVTVWSRKHRYAGTFDWLAEIDGKVWLGDTKTGKRVYDEVGLQLAALGNADFILREDGTEEPIPEWTRMAALHVRPRGWKLIPVLHGDRNWSAFLACRELYSWIHEVAPDVLGEAA
jgi:hypothetical protein